MKNSYLVISFIFLLGILPKINISEASDFYEEQKPDAKKLVSLQEKLKYLQISLSNFQLLLTDNDFEPGKKEKTTQYLALKQARGIGDYLYFFSIQVDHKSYDPKNYQLYFEILGSPKYKEKILSPMTLRILGAYGKADKDHYQGTYEIRYLNLPAFRFHILAIEMKKAQKLEQGVAFYILNGYSKKDSTQLSTLCKEEYAVTKEGNFVDETGSFISDKVDRWISLEEVIGEEILRQEPKLNTPKPKRAAFTRSPKKSSPGVTSLSDGSTDSCQTRSSEEAMIVSEISSTSIQSDRPPSTSTRRKGNFTLLKEETEALLREIRQEQDDKGDALYDGSPRSSSAPAVIVESSLSKVEEIIQSESLPSVSSPVERRKRNRAFTDGRASDLLKNKKQD